MAQALEIQKRKMVMRQKMMTIFILQVDKSILFLCLLLHLVLTKTQRQLPLVVLVLTAMVQDRVIMKLFMRQIILERTILRIARNVVQQDLRTLTFIIHVKPALERVT